MNSFDFDRLDPITREETLAFFIPDMQPNEGTEFTDYTAMLEDAVGAKSWLDENMEIQEQPMEGGEEGGSGILEDESSTVIGKDSPANAPELLANCNAPSTFSRREKMQKSGECTWESCSEEFDLQHDLDIHLLSHHEIALSLFIAPSRCPWDGCKSKAVFKSTKSCQHHLDNIHTKPLVCTVAKCSYTKPFRNQNDLERHKSTAHSDIRPYICPYTSCEAEVRSFSRKDKWMKHIEDIEHEDDALCIFPHCRVDQIERSTYFSTRKEIAKHFAKNHGSSTVESYECRLGSCSNNTNLDNLSKGGLVNHVKTFHGTRVSYWGVFAAVSKSKFLEAQNLYPYYTWDDCNHCAKVKAAEAYTNATLTGTL
ncbi:hypothetical protein G7Y89_g9696 [Cudoniella acicularis]|uniref:C2H2-type domain-containing protein n=1 Tax=Cudoniella acicularis TaxID=354080 RepID=A0A8H4RE63_9HELO|nr:hypothetical protein G7Y89_g9696 [Cudoniella acicularis]